MNKHGLVYPWIIPNDISTVFPVQLIFQMVMTRYGLVPAKQLAMKSLAVADNSCSNPMHISSQYDFSLYWNLTQTSYGIIVTETYFITIPFQRYSQLLLIDISLKCKCVWFWWHNHNVCIMGGAVRLNISLALTLLASHICTYILYTIYYIICIIQCVAFAVRMHIHVLVLQLTFCPK